MENSQGLPWTGERVVPTCGSQLLYEHLHRYAVAAALASGHRALDIACGEGYGSNLLAATATQVIGIDIAPEVINHARQAYAKENLIFREGSCLDIPVEDHSIDLVVSFETIEHIDDHPAFLREIKRVLTPDGTLIISSPDKAEYSDRTGTQNPFHKRELYHEEFHHLLEQHFKHCRLGKQKLVAGSWIAADTPSSEDHFGTFSGDIRYISFQNGVRDGLYSLAICSDAPLPAWTLGVYANSGESEKVWHLLEHYGNPEGIRKALAALQQREVESAHKTELLQLAAERDRANRQLAVQLESQLRHVREELARRDHANKQRIEQLESQLRQTRVNLSRRDTRINQLITDLRCQLLAAKKLTWFLKETEKSAARLRASRRWKLANPWAGLRALFGGRQVEGYGHLEKVVADYTRWRTAHPRISKIDEQLDALEREPSALPAQVTGRNGKVTPLTGPPAPTKPIEFPIRDQVDISIIVPVCNQLSFTQACLASIQEHQGELSFEVILVDDSSTDGTAETLAQISGLLYLRNAENLGFIASCNRGAAKARGNYLVFLNNDTVVTKGWLSALRETFDFQPEAGLVGSKLIYPDGRLQEAGGIIWRDGSGWNRGKFQDPSKPEFNFLCEVDYCSAASLMIPKSLFEKVGGFDKQYAPAYYEDTDLAFKVRAAGFKVLYQPLSQIIHFEGATGGTDLTAGAKKYQVSNRNTFLSKWADILSTRPVNGDVAALEESAPGQKRILVIDHHLPMPDRDSGSLRMFQILSILHQLGHRVTFIPDNLGNVPPYADELRKRGIEVLVRAHIASIGDYLQEHGSKLDIVILSRCATAAKHIPDVRLYAPASRVIFDTVDLHFLRATREAELTRNDEGRLLADQTRQQEYEVIRQADETWVVSEAERAVLLQDLPGKDIEIVSNIVEVREPTIPFAARADFLFIGSFLHPPNVDAVLYFTKEIYPMVAARLPEVKFYIIGGNAPPEVAALANDHVIVTGGVPDARPFFDSVKLSTAPLRYGAGVKGKINQSMGLGVPVLATSIAIEGMSLNEGEDVLVADEPTEFAEKLISLYQDQETWDRLSRNGLKKTQSLYSPAAAQEQLLRVLNYARVSEAR